jgi:hypothetical protein
MSQRASSKHFSMSSQTMTLQRYHTSEAVSMRERASEYLLTVSIHCVYNLDHSTFRKHAGIHTGIEEFVSSNIVKCLMSRKRDSSLYFTTRAFLFF